ncbi:MAG: DNRLRE domain-containing protein [bacterium]|nr:DNRLRE domain-containing protein [bacterium]
MIYYKENRAFNAAYLHEGRGKEAHFSARVWSKAGRPAIYRGLIAFDLTGIPSNAVIIEAKLKLYGTEHNTLIEDKQKPRTRTNASYLERITASWEEYTLTWYTQPASTPEGRCSLEGSVTTDQDYTVDITHFVRGWVRGSYHNHGLLLRLQKEERYARMVFASKDSYFVSKWPKLEITYRIANSF